jgi:NADH-quinone oxidoreductase subunit L
MTLPLVVLAVCAIALGFLGTPAFPWLQAKLLGEAEVHGHSVFEGAGLMMLSIVLVALGLGAGWAIYGRVKREKSTSPDPLAARFPGLIAFLAARMKFDELYAATVFKLNSATATFADVLDRFGWDGAVRFIARLGEFAGVVNREADEDGLNAGFDAGSEGLRSTGQAYSRAQTGDAHGYLRVLAIGFVLLVLIVMMGGAK